MADEKRLIDANALDIVANEDGIANGIWIGGRHGGQIMRLVLSTLKKMIDDAPTVDAVEVVHSAWKHGNCMNCGLYVGETTSKHFHYCPNCGAKMDEERKNENESKSNA